MEPNYKETFLERGIKYLTRAYELGSGRLLSSHEKILNCDRFPIRRTYFIFLYVFKRRRCTSLSSILACQITKKFLKEWLDKINCQN